MSCFFWSRLPQPLKRSLWQPLSRAVRAFAFPRAFLYLGRGAVYSAAKPSRQSYRLLVDYVSLNTTHRVWLELDKLTTPCQRRWRSAMRAPFESRMQIHVSVSCVYRRKIRCLRWVHIAHVQRLQWGSAILLCSLCPILFTVISDFRSQCGISNYNLYLLDINFVFWFLELDDFCICNVRMPLDDQ